MPKNIILLLLLLLCTKTIWGQKTVILLDKETEEPIVYANITFEERLVGISNMEGKVTINSSFLNKKGAFEIESISYQNLLFNGMDLNNQKETVFYLMEDIRTIPDIVLSNSSLDIKKLISGIKDSLESNYNFKNTKTRLFSRSVFKNVLNDFDMKVKKNSEANRKELKAINTSIQKLNKEMIPTVNNSIYYSDTLMDVFCNDSTNLKVSVLQSTSISENENAINSIQKKVSESLLKNLGNDSTYKVKSGWFKIDDSVSLDFNKDEPDSIKHRRLVKNAKRYMKYRLKNTHFQNKKEAILQVLEVNKYQYTIEDIFYKGEDMLYKIQFSPKKSSGDYQGYMHVNIQDYAITKVHLGYAPNKYGRNLNLKLVLGVQYKETEKEETLLYRKNANNFYQLYYQKIKEVSVTDAVRPIKLIGNESKDKVKLKLDMNITSIYENETFASEMEALSQREYELLIEEKYFTKIPLQKYDPSIWSNYTILEPLQEVKEYELQE